MNLRAEFHERRAVENAVEGLRSEGFDPGDIEIFSTEPVDFKPGVLDRPSRMSIIAVAGAILNGGLATAFMFYTQYDYPLVTGGMPLTSHWATGVITFELTMAGAVAGTVLAMLWEGGFFRRRKLPVPKLRDGSIFLQLHCSEPEETRVSDSLREAGATAVETLEEGA